MKVYRCYAKVVGSKYLGTVEANSEKEAIDKAYELNECYITLCHYCSSECEDAEVTDVTVEEDN